MGIEKTLKGSKKADFESVQETADYLNEVVRLNPRFEMVAYSKKGFFGKWEEQGVLESISVEESPHKKGWYNISGTYEIKAINPTSQNIIPNIDTVKVASQNGIEVIKKEDKTKWLYALREKNQQDYVELQEK